MQELYFIKYVVSLDNTIYCIVQHADKKYKYIFSPIEIITIEEAAKALEDQTD